MQTPLSDSTDPALLAGVDDDDDNDTSLAGVPIPITNNDNDDSDTESDHNSVDPNEANDNSSKASIHSTRSQVPVHNTTDEPPQLPLDEEELDNTQLPELETHVPVLCQSKRVSVPPSNYICQMGGKAYTMNVQAETNQDKNKGLVYNHGEASVLATIITTFNESMEHTVEEQGQQYVVTYSLKAGINKFGEQAKASAHKEMKQLHDRSCFRPVHKHLLNKSERKRVMESLLFLTERRDKMIKSQHCANRSTQCTYMEHDKVMSLTVSMEGTLLTTVIEAQEGQDVTTCDIPNALSRLMWKRRTKMEIKPS